MKFINGNNPPRGHYTPAIISGNTIYLSGQTSSDPSTGVVVEGDFRDELLMAFNKAEDILLTVGVNRNHVLMCRIYITDIEY
ncbi:MAG: Rid family hydrolase, partial [Gallicola sp.]|nr:Rid family hydrolase [Gallicola sp.]